MKVTSFRIRASYPNFYMVNLYAREGRELFNHDSEDPLNQLEGNKPGTVIYRLEGDTQDVTREFPPRWYDMYCMLKQTEVERRHYLEMLLQEQQGAKVDELESRREEFRRTCQSYAADNPLHDNDCLITTLSSGEFTDEEISYKGRMLMDLTRNCYPVPDFCILTSKSFNQPERLPELLETAIKDLETMTNCSLGANHNPLVFAIRCAMPQYIPGLMPTLLNIGVTRTSYEALRKMYADAMANRVYLSTLHSISEMLSIEHRYSRSDISLSNQEQEQRIAELESRIGAIDPRLLEDAHYQALQLVLHVRRFYLNNSDLILTFMQGKQAFPSLILQRMVWTIGNNESYPGVLYSRHSRTGVGKQIESYRNIFGEEIMTGDVTTEDLAYRDRTEIRRQFPAVYHFDPLLKKLEGRYKTPVTIEFAVETRPHQLSLFSVLQLNPSEMTGRAALISAIDLRHEGLVSDSNVMDLIKPYHLRQIISDTIDSHSIARLAFFGYGLSVLPSTAISARLCLSISKAREFKTKGENVCLCQEHFVPQDTITLNEVQAILSMMPAAIHVVTACRGYGIPALMDLHTYGIRIEGNTIVNSDGLTIHEGEMITMSSKNQSLFKGQADFKPARFTKYISGGKVDIEDDEKGFFERMKAAYQEYQDIVTSQEAAYITDIHKLARLIRCDLQDRPKKAADIVNSWYEARPDDYVSGVLQSRMGDHNDQSRLFNLLHTSHKTNFFQRISGTCLRQGLSGLTAGSFMIGRFVAHPLPVLMWNSLSDTVVAFLLNEYVLYEKYQQVLQEVGEIKLARAHSRIETEGIDNMVLRNFDLTNFIPLLHSNHRWDQVSAALETIDHQDNTHLLVAMLSKPLDQLFDLTSPWKRAQVEDTLRQAGA